MSISPETVAALAPDQASLKAASKLMKAGKWPVRKIEPQSELVWGECQGSGANPYLTVFHLSDHGYKCTCPSRKFPCKHALALMWMYAEGPADFSNATDVPQWVTDWLGRRRKSSGTAAATGAAKPSADGKNLSMARVEDAPTPKPDAKTQARRAAASKKRAEDTKVTLLRAAEDLETWIDDQLRTGLGALSNDLGPRCRSIAARMIDGKASTLAGRLDEIPAMIMALPGEERLDALIAALSKLIILARAFRANPDDPDARRAMAMAETSDAVLNNPDAIRVTSDWEVIGERIVTRRDDLISQSTWLLNLGSVGPKFALLIDFFPASVGRRTGTFANGDQFHGELVFYPSSSPVRALIQNRTDCAKHNWPTAPDMPLADAADFETRQPWSEMAPVLMPAGRIAVTDKGDGWWVSDQGSLSLPIDHIANPALPGIVLDQTTALWNGSRLSLMSAQTRWGRVTLDG